MCNQRGSVLHSNFSMLQIGHRMTDRNSDATFDQLVDSFRRLPLLRRQRNDGDVANVAINLLHRLKTLVKFTNAVRRMSSFLIN